jgi:GTP-binding protein EngB required for normal cell division
MSLRNYEQEKFAFAEILRAAANLAPTEDSALRERFHDLFIRLAEDRFNLVVVGRFNRGKTSLMNAMLGSSHLPVGIVPLTSVITTVSYGTTEGAVLHFHRSSLTTDVPLGELAKYITEEGNPGNSRGIKVADVKLRAEVLRRGFYFVDTPGLSSAIVQNTLTTEAYLPEADAFLLVTSYDSPLTEEEIRFLRSVSASARRIFVVLNKQDYVTADQRATVLTYVRQQLDTIFRDCTPRVFSVSARDGLDARRAQDQERLSASGMLALETDLAAFLLDDKRDHFLRQMCRRGAEVIRMLPTSPETNGLVARMAVLSERLAGPRGHLEIVASVDAARVPAPPSLNQLKPCEVCSHVTEALWDFERIYQSDISIDPRKQGKFVAAGGLCSFHTWQYNEMVSAYGVCTAYPPLLDHIARWLRTAAGEPSPVKNGRGLRLPVAAHDHCLLCTIRAKAEGEAVNRLAARFAKQGVQALASLSAICLPHLSQLSAVLQNPEHVRLLMRHQATLLERVSEDMRRYTLKRDATRRNLETKEEVAAAQRALLLVAGHREVTAAADNRMGGA